MWVCVCVRNAFVFFCACKCVRMGREVCVHVSAGEGGEGIGVGGGCGMYRCVWERGEARCEGMCTCMYIPSALLYAHAYTCLHLCINKM